MKQVEFEILEANEYVAKNMYKSIQNKYVDLKKEKIRQYYEWKELKIKLEQERTRRKKRGL